MPNIVAHYICGVLVANKLEINDDAFLKGNLFPDYVDKTKHYRIPGKRFEIPDIDRFMKEEKMENELFKMGFLAHLILDKLFLDDYVINDIYSRVNESVDIFEVDKIYRDYTNMSKGLLTHYLLNLDEIDELMLPESEYIDIEKYRSNTDVIRESNSEDLKYIDLDNFIHFLDTSVDEIYAYIKNIRKREKNMISANYLPKRKEVNVDFETDLEKYVYEECDYVKDIIKVYPELDKMIRQALANGLFFRNTENHSSFNYWQPLSNAGIPAVPREDYIHELTFFIHDILHNMIPDLQITGRSELDKKVYIIERMLGEGVCLVLADMYFIDALKELGVDYDFYKKNIYQGFNALRNNDLYDNLLGNVMFCTLGIKDYFDIDEDYEEDLDKYLEWFSPVYISDLKWTLSNVNSKLCRAKASFDWFEDYKDIIPGSLSNDNSMMLSTSYLIKKLNLNDEMTEEELTKKIFDYVYENILTYDGEITEDLDGAKKRFYGFQSKIAYDYVLDKDLYKSLIINGDYDEFERVYQKDLAELLEKRLITEKEYNIFREVYPHHTACFISYTSKYVEDVDIKTYSKKNVFGVL